MNGRPSPQIAVLGVGTMGSGMARNVLAAGFALTVYNRDRRKAEPFGAAGARVADSPRDAAGGADFIVSVVADDEASRAIWMGPEGALAGAKPGAILIESSTLTVGWIRELEAEATRLGLDLLDAPVTGSRLEAEAGTLRFLVGGAIAAFERARPVLESMARTLVHLGPSGSGALMKLVNNFLSGVHAASLAEAVAMAERGGLDPVRTIELLSDGAPGSPMVKKVGARIAAGDYTPDFALRLMVKDLGYVRAEGAEHSLAMKMAAAAHEVLQNGVEAGFGDRDVASVVEQFRTDATS